MRALTKPLLPAVDAAGQLREVAFALLLRGRRPVEVADLAAATSLRLDAATAAAATLATAGWLDLDESGRVAGAAGLSLVAGPHRLTLGKARFRTWCAYDCVGIAAALGGDALIETACGQCDAPITLALRSGVPERSGPERLWPLTVGRTSAARSAPRPCCSAATRTRQPGGLPGKVTGAASTSPMPPVGAPPIGPAARPPPGD